MNEVLEETAQRTQQALQMAEYAHNHRDAKLTPTQDFQAELGRQMICHGFERGLEQSTDKDIAFRMTLAGYHHHSVAQAVNEGSLAKQRAELSNPDMSRDIYGAHITASVYREAPEIYKYAGAIAEWKRNNNLNDEYRLDKIGDLATDIRAEHCQKLCHEPSR